MRFPNKIKGLCPTSPHVFNQGEADGRIRSWGLWRSALLVFLPALIAFLSPACRPTYQRATMTDAIQRLLLKEYKLSVDVKEKGETIGVQYKSDALMQDIINPDNLNHLFFITSRVVASSDRPPRYVVIDMVDRVNPNTHIILTYATVDLKKSWGDAMSRTDFSDRQLLEYEINGKRSIFDVKNMDAVDLIMLSAEGSNPEPQVTRTFNLTDVKDSEFVAKVTGNVVRRILQEQEEKEKRFYVRDVSSLYLNGSDFKGFRIVVDLVGRTNDESFPALLQNKIFPHIMESVNQVMGSYKFSDFTQIAVVEKNTGRIMTRIK